MLILALDPATKCGWCCGATGAKPQLGTVNFGGRELDDHTDITVRAQIWIERQLSPEAIFGLPHALAIEKPIAPWQIHGETQWKTTELAIELQGIFKTAARRRFVRIVEAPIGTWRKYALGRGNMKGVDAKAAMLRLVGQLGWTDEDTDHNAAEACGIWLYAGGIMEPARVKRHEPLFVGR